MQPGNLNILTRRSFLDRSFKTSLAVALSTLLDIPFVMKRALAEGSIGLNGKKVLFIWLRGANDALNSVIPAGDPQYASSRPTLAVPTGSGWQATSGGAESFDSGIGPTYGNTNPNDGPLQPALGLGNGFAALHPSLKFLAPVYNAGELALIHRVAYPRQSRSHFDSQRYWENGTPNNNLVNDGIFYRTIYQSGLANSSPLTGVSIQSSLPLILRGSRAAMTNLTDPTRYNLLSIPTPAGDAKADAALFSANGIPFPPKLSRELLSLQYQNLQQTLSLFARIDFRDTGNTFQDDIKTDGDVAWVAPAGTGGDAARGYFLFPTTNLKNGGWRRPSGANDADKYVVDPSLQNFFNNLKSAAIVLNKTDAIIAGTEYGGFDTHRAQGQVTGAHPRLNRGIGWALYALRKYFTLYADRATWNDIIVVTLSEFGRTTVENSDEGTDHAEAGVIWVAGGAVKGYGKDVAGSPRPSGVFNCSPTEFAANSPLNWFDPANSGRSAMFGVSNGYLKRNTDYRSVLGEVIRKHLGATLDQLKIILPGYAAPNEALLAGGVSGVDLTPIRGEVGIL
ncbi:MAG TPA: DUF1501 domain-containing protein [Verrucomicrobiae bacterium]|nr:DUF1501 domain-containing protein [Verrucomicrobiae bacterium]